jgi:glycosyltransferase involved in cell wall biosynthesis
MSTDATRKIIQSATEKYKNMYMIDNIHRVVPYALNIGIEKAQGDIIVRIDAHAAFPSNYVSTLVKYLNCLPNAQNVGAPCVTQTLGTTHKAKAIMAVLSNKWGVGNSTFRLGVEEVQIVDTVPFGCWKKDTLVNIGMFNTNLIRNQDIELNKRLAKAGGNIYLVPNTHCIYYARETYQSLAKNNFGNGKWNILTVFYTKQLSSLSIRHFIPLLFVLSLIIPTILSLVFAPLIIISLLSLFAYVCLLGLISLKLCVNKRLNFFYLLTSFLVLHLSYGWGSLIGLIKLPFLSR